ncbi:hypothetical protein C0J52_07281 [Blattella germanica]|nr:hypothetical protein C0J52_07281 [Blattella germanica]
MLEVLSVQKWRLVSIFSDEATFFLGGKANRHNVRIWGRPTENPRVYVEHSQVEISALVVYGTVSFNKHAEDLCLEIIQIAAFIIPYTRTKSHQSLAITSEVMELYLESSIKA